MIDIKTHTRMHPSSGNSGLWGSPGCTIIDSAEFDTWPKKITASETLKDEVSMLLPYKVPGFEMESKKWGMRPTAPHFSEQTDTSFQSS